MTSREHADVARESVVWVASEIMEAEVANQVGAELGEISPDRVAQLYGYRPRAWDTRTGEIELLVRLMIIKQRSGWGLHPPPGLDSALGTTT